MRSFRLPVEHPNDTTSEDFMQRLLLVAALFTAEALAQLSGGFKVGVPLTDAFDIASNPAAPRTYLSKTRRYIFGPQVELRLPAGIGIEFNALYTNLNFSSVSLLTTALGLNYITDADSWEFPLLLKYRFKSGSSLRPFVGTGASFRRITDIDRIGSFLTGRADESPELRDKNAIGFVIGGGVEIKALFLRISPELRFTRWGAENFIDGLTNVLHSSRNQGVFLVGIHF
ncbi:MAG: outer membrane beta-barrel protein [Acidobacteria bacterium]|nr:outer membrane beta-barrel protein [Acidobacteriota bacterium]